MNNLEKPGPVEFAVRAQPDLINLCRTLKINISEVTREALAKEVRRRSRAAKAPAILRSPLDYVPPPRPARTRKHSASYLVQS